MEYTVQQGHEYGAYAAVMAASEQTHRWLPKPEIRTDGLELFDGEISIKPEVPFQFYHGFIQIGFDVKTHPGIMQKFRYLDYNAGLGRDIVLGQQHPDTGLWYIGVRDLEIVNVQGVLTPFHFPHHCASEEFWGEAHIVEEEDGVGLILLPQASYTESY